MRPFWILVGKTVQEIRADWMVFVERDPVQIFAGVPVTAGALPANVVSAPHWCTRRAPPVAGSRVTEGAADDASMLSLKRLLWPVNLDVIAGRLVFGTQGVAQMYVRQLRQIAAAGEVFGGVPSLLGEFGIPMDLNHGLAFAKWRAGNRSETVWRGSEAPARAGGG